MSKPIVLSSLEEDFQRIGLVPEASFSGSAEVLSEEAETEDVSEASEEEDASVEESEEAIGLSEAEELTERLRLLRQRRATSKVRRQRIKTKRKRMRIRARLRLKAKRFRRSARGKRFLRKYKMALKRYHGHAPRGRRISLKMGTDRVSNMLEDVAELMQAVDGFDRKEAMRAFANIALVSDKLSEGFEKLLTQLGESGDASVAPEHYSLAEHFDAMALDAADIAELLKSSVSGGSKLPATPDELQEAFGTMMSELMEGLEFYADALEAEGLDEGLMDTLAGAGEAAKDFMMSGGVAPLALAAGAGALAHKMLSKDKEEGEEDEEDESYEDEDESYEDEDEAEEEAPPKGKKHHNAWPKSQRKVVGRKGAHKPEPFRP